MKIPKLKSHTEDVTVRFQFRVNWTLVFSIIAVALFVGGVYLGYTYEKDNALTHPPLALVAQQSVNGKVTSVNDKGLKVNDGSATWDVRYDKATQFQSSTGQASKSDIHKDDQVQISGVGDPKKKTLTAQTISVILPPSPSPSASPSPAPKK